MKRSPLRLRKAATRRTTSASERLQDRNRKQRRSIFLEKLEDRSLLATMLWSGASTVDSNWTTGANWVGGVAPQQDDSLVFPFGAGRQSNTDDFAAGTRFRSITISDGYTLSGSNAITLLEGVTMNAATATA